MIMKEIRKLGVNYCVSISLQKNIALDNRYIISDPLNESWYLFNY